MTDPSNADPGRGALIPPRENYRRAIEFGGPEYLPSRIGCALDWLYEKDEVKQARIRELQARMPDEFVPGLWCWTAGREPTVENGVRRWVDEWGTGWIDDGLGAKTETYPMEAGYEHIDRVRFPRPDDAGRFDRADGYLAQRGDRYACACVWFTLFERLWMLRGFDNMLIDPYLEPRDFAKLRDRVLEVDLGMIDKWIERGVDGIFFSDDWGSQRGLLINPEDWRKLYKPAYAEMFERVRAGGAHVWMHLCGDITAILGDLIDIGLSVLNPVQPQAMDVEILAREFGGKVCFNGGVDVQGTMIRGTPQDVRDEVRRLVDLFGRYNGGYIGDTSHSIMPETPLDNVIALYEAFEELR
jgi:uroporphyrinogen decarboxylase